MNRQVVTLVVGEWRGSAMAVQARALKRSSWPDTEEARDRLLDHYLVEAEAADERLRDLQPTVASQEFSDRNEALAWLDAERSCLVAAVQMSADTGRDQAGRVCLC